MATVFVAQTITEIIASFNIVMFDAPGWTFFFSHHFYCTKYQCLVHKLISIVFIFAVIIFYWFPVINVTYVLNNMRFMEFIFFFCIGYSIKKKFNIYLNHTKIRIFLLLYMHLTRAQQLDHTYT